MKIVCAWCGKDLGEKEPLHDQSITHGICEVCLTGVMAELSEAEAQHKRKDENMSIKTGDSDIVTNTWQRVDVHLQSAYTELIKAMTATGAHVWADAEYDEKLAEVMETVFSAIDEVRQLADWCRKFDIGRIT